MPYTDTTDSGGGDPLTTVSAGLLALAGAGARGLLPPLRHLVAARLLGAVVSRGAASCPSAGC